MTRIWSKKETQHFIKRLRAAGYTVTKVAGGYVGTIDGEEIFRALIGTRGYLCRIAAEVMQPVEGDF
jgi:hypothetical protein